MKAQEGRLGRRALGWLVVAIVAIVAISARSHAAAAAPRPASRKPAATRGHGAPARASAADQAELAQLDQDITAAQLEQANFAAARRAKRALALQTRLTGADSAPVQRRKQTLAGMLGQTGDSRGQLALDQELLAAAEKQHGPESREVLTALAFLAGPYWAAGRHDELETVMQRQLALTRKLDGENSMAYANLLSQYGTLLTQRNEPCPTATSTSPAG